tara:strand:- start:192 stop:488 length:297 start_codon:yes stop_codon:yes gene_type:complete
MKDTNAIEKAINRKIEIEIEVIVDKFLHDIQIELRDKYNAVSFYDITRDNSEEAKEKTILVQGMHQLKNILVRMLRQGHGEAMLNKKSKELLDRLEIL